MMLRNFLKSKNKQKKDVDEPIPLTSPRPVSKPGKGYMNAMLQRRTIDQNVYNTPSKIKMFGKQK